MDDAVRRLIVWHQEEIKRLTGMLSDVYVVNTQDDDAVAQPTEHLAYGSTQQQQYYSPLSSWDGGGNDTAPVSPAALSPDMFAPQTVVPESQSMPRNSTFVDFLDTLASDEEPTQ